MFEVEQKYRLDDGEKLAASLSKLGGQESPPQTHRDTYYNHPCRDFAETREALRVRRVDGVPMVTYKGSVLPGTIKARQELEWRLDPGDDDGSKTEKLLTLLGFRRVATVEKRRRSFGFSGDLSDFTVVVDQVTGLGDYCEIELLVADRGQIEAARQQIADFSARLELHHGESRSYLSILLESGNE